MSLRDPSRKMSKSDPIPGARILITDNGTEIASKFRRAMTDSNPAGSITYDPAARPGVANLIEIYAHMHRRSDFNVIAETELHNLGLAALKERVADCVAAELAPVRHEFLRLVEQERSFLDQVAAEGARKARESAEATMMLARKAVGLA